MDAFLKEGKWVSCHMGLALMVKLLSRSILGAEKAFLLPKAKSNTNTMAAWESNKVSGSPSSHIDLSRLRIQSDLKKSVHYPW